MSSDVGRDGKGGKSFLKLLFSGHFFSAIFRCVTSFKFIFVILSISIFLFVIFLIVAASKVTVSQSVLDSLMDYNPPTATLFFDNSGNVFAEVAKERRVFATIDQIPVILKNAFIAAEDRTFYTNPGVDFFGLIRASFQNIIILFKMISDKNERLVGASTITQQVVRNLLLNKDRNIVRKFKEIILSLKISTVLKKDQIFEIYLNHIYLGSRTYGVIVASREYFGKELSDLTIAECAVLAGLPKAPSALDPVRNPVRSLQRRNWVLRRMFAEGFINRLEYLNAIKSPLIVSYVDRATTFGWGFLEYVKSVLAVNGIDLDQLQTGGYRVYTTMNKEWQNIAQEELDAGLRLYSRRHGYTGPIARISVDGDWNAELKSVVKPAKIGTSLKMAVVLSVHDGPPESSYAVIGLENGIVGKIAFAGLSWARRWISQTSTTSFPVRVSDVLSVGDVVTVASANTGEVGLYTLDQVPVIDGSVVIMNPSNGNIFAMVGGYSDIPATFNRAFQAKRQAGSVVKPFVYMSAIENGFKPNDIFVDSEITFNLGNGELWSPQNASRPFVGPVTMRTGLENSLNVVTIRVAQSAGLGNVLKTFKKFDVLTNYPPNLSISIGSAETTLLNISRAYAVIVNGGTDVHATPLLNVTTESGGVIGSDFIPSTSKPHSYRDNKASGWTVFGKGFNIFDDNVTSGKANGESTHEVKRQIVDERTAYQVISLLAGVVRTGSVARRTTEIQDVIFAGKTGTSQDGRDLWFIGITPDVVIGVYSGYDTPTSTGNEFGSTVALPIFTGIMKRIKKDLSKADFTIPSGVKFIKINKSTGIPVSDSNSIDTKTIYEVFKDTDSVFSEDGVKELTVVSAPGEDPYFHSKTDIKKVDRSDNQIDLGGIY